MVLPGYGKAELVQMTCTLSDINTSLSFLNSAACPMLRIMLFQVLAFILGRGVLVLPLSLPQFAAVMLVPFMPAQMMAGQPTQQLQHTTATGQTGAIADAASAVNPRKAAKRSVVFAWQQVTPLQRYSIDVKPSSRPPSPPPAAAAAAAAAPKQKATRLSAVTGTPHQQWQRTANLLLNVAVTAAFIAYTTNSRQRFIATLLHLGSLGVMWRAMELLMVAASVPARDWLGARCSMRVATRPRLQKLQ
jgi:hypothetical protein